MIGVTELAVAERGCSVMVTVYIKYQRLHAPHDEINVLSPFTIIVLCIFIEKNQHSETLYEDFIN